MYVICTYNIIFIYIISLNKSKTRKVYIVILYYLDIEEHCVDINKGSKVTLCLRIDERKSCTECCLILSYKNMTYINIKNSKVLYQKKFIDISIFGV